MHKSFIIYFIFILVDMLAQLFVFLPMQWGWCIALIGHVLIAFSASIWISKSDFKNSLNGYKALVALFLFILFLPVISLFVLWLLDEKDILRERYKDAVSQKKASESSQNTYDYLKKIELLDDSNKIKNTRTLLSTLNDENYLKLLIASRHLPDKAAYALLKEALGSPFESARLMAFSLKGKLENRLEKTLQKDLALLEALPVIERAEQHLVVARNYINLLDIGVLSGSEDKQLKQAQYHCFQSIRLNKKSAYPYQTLSKVFSYQGKIKQSQQAKKIAASL